MAKRDYYDVLGVSKTATQDEIRKAHRKLVRQYHPDVNKNNPKSEEKFKEVQEAYDVLSDDGKLETIDVKVPAGVKEGSRVRIKGRGQHIPNGEAGDLFIVTKVLPHPYFRREGIDIYVDVPISLYEALLGTKVEVPTLDGPV